MKHKSSTILVLAAALFVPFGFGAPTQPTLSVSPSSLSFAYQIGAALPAPVNCQVRVTGSTTPLVFTASVVGSAQWLIVTPLTGNTGTSVSFRVNPTSLLAGVYTATVQFTAAGASAPVNVAVTLTVRNPPPNMVVTPGAVTVSWATDQAQPSDVPIAVTTDGEPVSFQASTKAAWLSLDKTIGIAMVGSPVTVTTTIVTDGLTPGSYTGQITFASANAANRSVVVSVSLTVTPGTAVIDSIWPNAAPIGSNDSTITIRGQHLFRTSVVTAGTTTLTTTWISTTVMLALIPRTLLATEGALGVKVRNDPSPISNTVNFTVTAPGPVIQTVVNAASFNAPSGVPTVAPGEIISVFGSGLGPSTAVSSDPSGGAYPATVGTPATTIEFELTTGVWTASPIIMASANQINAVAPFVLPPGSGRRLRVTYNTLTSAPLTFSAPSADPGVFTMNSSGRGQGAILNYNATTGAFSFNSATNPAAKGSTVVLYLTGGGTTTPMPSPEGQIVATSGSPPTLDGTPAVTIGGDGATVQSATSAPGCVAGLVQLNVTVPSSVTAGSALPVVVTIGGNASPATATIAVR